MAIQKISLKAAENYYELAQKFIKDGEKIRYPYISASTYIRPQNIESKHPYFSATAPIDDSVMKDVGQNIDFFAF